MNEKCIYSEICAHYIKENCEDSEYLWRNCDKYRIFEGILDRQVFQNQILKRIFRDGREDGFDTDTDHLIDRD